MSSFGFKILNADRLVKKIQRLESEIKAPTIDGVREAVFLVHKTAVESIQDNSSGVPQARYTNGKKRIVLASKPGEPPNTDTGILVKSIKFDFKKGGLIGRVGTNLRYGAWLEFGTKKMAARPWLSAAIRQTKEEVAKLIAKSVRAALRGGK